MKLEVEKIWQNKKIPQNMINSLISRIDFPNNNDDCWIWFGSFNKFGYGRMRISQKNYLIHRLIFSFYYDFNENDYICHKCDIRNCVNPNHLFIGNQSDNMLDMVLKGRSCKGENHPKAILSDDLVREIITKANNNEFTSIKQISEIYDISRHIIGKIFNGRIWTHISQEFDDILNIRKKIR